MREAIGIFDSGVGGLTVLTALRRRLPHQDFLYLGDTARLPYGSKSEGTIRRYALNAASHLFRRDIRLLVVACNTASAHALPALAEISPVPVLGVIEPGVRSALASGARRVAVIGTEGTIRSGAYQEALHRLAPEVSVSAAPCPLFVPLAEEGWGDHPVTDRIAEIYLRPLLEAGLEAIILGCTHYPLLRPSLPGRRRRGPTDRFGDGGHRHGDRTIPWTGGRRPARPGRTAPDRRLRTVSQDHSGDSRFGTGTPRSRRPLITAQSSRRAPKTPPDFFDTVRPLPGNE